MTFGKGRFATQNVKNGRNAKGYKILFNAIGKKNNQTSVFDADREIATPGSKDNAGKSVNLVSGIIRSPLGWNFSICSRPIVDSICRPTYACSAVSFSLVGWSGGALVLGKLPVPGRPTILDNSGARAY